MISDFEMKIKSFKGIPQIGPRGYSHKCQLTVEYDGKSLNITIPVFGYNAADAVKKGRVWRNKESNMERLKAAILGGLSNVPAETFKKV